MAVVVGLCTLEIYIPGAASLKEKRSVLKSLLEGMRSRFNVSASEVEHMDLWQRAAIGIACVSNSRSFADQVLNKAVAWVESNPRVHVTAVEVEFL